MLDLSGILFSSIMMLLVIFRAVQLDAVMPWFKPMRTGTDSSGLRLRPDGQVPSAADGRASKGSAPQGRGPGERMAARGTQSRARQPR